VAGNFIFRLREFEQMEIEYFIRPDADWESIFASWLKLQEEFAMELGAGAASLRQYEHPKEKLSFYSKKTVDIEYDFPFGGFKELFGLAYRTDYDLSNHAKHSGQKLEYFDTEKNEWFVPHVVEPTFGLDRCILTALLSAYREEKLPAAEGKEEEVRTVLALPKYLAPVKVAVFPLLKNKPDLVAKAKEIYTTLKKDLACEFDDNGNVGKRYRRQDEIGTPYCVTVDFDTLEQGTVTVRDRDTMQQDRVPVADLPTWLKDRLNA
jgi:glycyl-tRNA synthetase